SGGRGAVLLPDVPRIPDLDLRRAAQVEAAVGPGGNLPVAVELEVAVVLRGAEARALAVVDEGSVLDAPVGVHRFVGFGPGLFQRVSGESAPLDRVVVDESLPAGEVLAVEEGGETGGRSVVGIAFQDGFGGGEVGDLEV